MENFITFTLLVGLAIGHFAYVLKNTDFIVEYGKLVYLERFLRADEYKRWKEEFNEEPDYPGFLADKFVNDNNWKIKNWALKLFGCPYCFSTFLCSLVSIFILSWWTPILGLAAGGIAGITYSLESLLYKKNNT